MLRKLLRRQFPGSEALNCQLNAASAVEVSKERSIRIETPGDLPNAAVLGRIPVEARATDDDGIAINVLLHVVEGRLNELQIYKDDSSPVRHLPAPEVFEVSVHCRDYDPFKR